MSRFFFTLALSAALLIAGALVPARTGGGLFEKPAPAACCTLA